MLRAVINLGRRLIQERDLAFCLQERVGQRQELLLPRGEIIRKIVETKLFNAWRVIVHLLLAVKCCSMKCSLQLFVSESALRVQILSNRVCSNYEGMLQDNIDLIS